MTQIRTDLIEGSEISDTADGIELVRVYVVSGLSGSKEQRLYSALTASGIPRRGDAHPYVPDAEVVTRRATPHGPTIARVTVTYSTGTTATEGDTGQEQVEIGTTLQTKQTSYDAYGQQIVLTSTVPQYDADGNITGDTQVEQVATVSVQVPTVVYRVQRKEDDAPGLAARNLVGRVGDFAGGAQGYRWLCTRVEGVSQDGGTTFDCTYEFQYDPDGWDARLDVIDPSTGQPYVGIPPRRIPIYQSANFGVLGLKNPVWFS